MATSTSQLHLQMRTMAIVAPQTEKPALELAFSHSLNLTFWSQPAAAIREKKSALV